MPKIVSPTIQQLRLFDAVARHRSFTRASEEVSLTQPTVSMQVKSLEDKIGLPLTEKSGKQLGLTLAGEEVARAAHDILERLSGLEDGLRDLHREVTGRLSVAVVSTARYFLPQLLGQFQRRYPRVQPQLQITNRENILARMEQNQDDLYIMGQPPEGASVTSRPFEENVILFVAPPDHSLVGQRKIPLSRIASEPLIRREAGSGTRKAVEAKFAAAGVKLGGHMEFDDSEAIKQGVISGLGLAYVSEHALRLELAAGELAVLDVEGFPLRRRWFVMHRDDKRMTNAALAFVEFLLAESGRV